MGTDIEKDVIKNLVDYFSSEGLVFHLLSNKNLSEFESNIKILDGHEKLEDILDGDNIHRKMVIGQNVPNSLKGKVYAVELGSHNVNDSSFYVDELIQVKDIYKKLKKTFVIVPAYNEDRTLSSVLDDLKKYFKNGQIVVIDDGSGDNTREIAKSKNVEIISHIINRGLGGALSTGIEFTVEKGAENIITFDADGQHDVKDVKKLLYPLINEEASFVIGSRFKGDTSKMPFIKVLGNKILNYITFGLTGRLVTDSQSGFRGISRDMAKDIELKCDRYAISSELIMESKDLKLVEVPIPAIYDEYSSKKGTNVISGIKIFLKLIYKILSQF